MNQHWTERLSEYLDDELTVAERVACDAHLTHCAECREVLTALGEVIAFAKDDPDQMPATELWPGLLSRIAPVGPQSAAQAAALLSIRGAQSNQRGRASASRQIVFTLPQLALAASLLVAVSAGVAYLAASRTASPVAVGEDAIQAQAEPVLPPSPDVKPANFADEQYDQAVTDLEKILVDMRDELDPRTIVIIERNLAAIDQAIREARAALDADPANTYLNSHLADARRKKLDLLRRATMIGSTSGD